MFQCLCTVFRELTHCVCWSYRRGIIIEMKLHKPPAGTAFYQQNVLPHNDLLLYIILIFENFTKQNISSLKTVQKNLRFFHVFNSVVRQIPRYNSQRRGTVRTVLMLFCVLFVCKCVLYRTVLYCTVLYCTVLYCTVLYRTVPYRTVLYRTVPYRTVLYCTVLLPAGCQPNCS